MWKGGFFPQKPAFPFERAFRAEEAEQPLERAIPETQGYPPPVLRPLLKDLALHESIDIHQIALVRNGKSSVNVGLPLILRGCGMQAYSMCKSITGMAIGMLIAEGKLKLGDKVIDVFHTRKKSVQYFPAEGCHRGKPAGHDQLRQL